MQYTKGPLAEVVESSLLGFTAQCWEWKEFPPFGSLVEVESGNLTIFGIVHQVSTGSLDPSRYPFAYKKTEAQLLQEQPQIFEFLKTTLSAIPIGYMKAGHAYAVLPPEPAKIHSFLSLSSMVHCKKLVADNKYLPLLFGLQGHVFNIDELLLAFLPSLSSVVPLNQSFLCRFMESYACLVGSDYRRIKIFCQRLDHLALY